MLVFISCVKHPDNSRSYDKVWQMLNNTLYSVCSQQDTDFRVIVVCDRQLPLQHHEELINQYTEFIEVDFPGHSQEVIEKFNRLGNLSPPLDNLQWWGIQNDYQTAVRQHRSARSKLIRLLEWFVGDKGIHKLREVKQSIKRLLNGEKNYRQKLARDHYYISNVVLNMASKLIIGILAAKKHNPDYVMFFDADDYIGNDISAYVNAHPGENGWIMAHGYKMCGTKIVPFFRWNSICGTGNIINFALLTGWIGPGLSEKSGQDELFERVDSELLFTIGRHDRIRAYFAAREWPLLEYPTRSVIHQVGHDESSEYTRSMIREEPAGLELQKSRKFGDIVPIYSRLIGYFNVLPAHSRRVFCLGFQKTGTTSVDWVLQSMGYQVAKAYKQSDINFCRMLENGDLSELKQLSELFDAFQDIPWFNYYREFDRWYPGSKFILTIRDTRSWWASFYHYFRTENYPLFELIYGAANPKGCKEILVERYERHNRDVIEYFKGRSDDLLVIDVSDVDALKKIEKFLGQHSTFSSMPHKNATLREPKDKTAFSPKRQLKRLLRVRFVSAVKMLTLSAPPIIIGGCRKSGVDFMLSILSCHPHIHAIGGMKLRYPLRHPLSPDRTLEFEQVNNEATASVNQKILLSKLLKAPIGLSARRWCAMNVLSVLVYDRLLAEYGSKIRIINVVRDGRDVVLENDKVVLGKHAVECERWVYDIKAGIEFENHAQVLTVRYEDLVQDYGQTIRRVCDFIGEQDETPLLSYPKHATTMEEGYWIGKWQQPQYANRVEQLLQTPGAQECLQHYGYGHNGSQGINNNLIMKEPKKQ